MARRSAKEAADKLRSSNSKKDEKEVVKRTETNKANKSVNYKKASNAQKRKDAPVLRGATTAAKASGTKNSKNTEATVSNKPVKATISISKAATPYTTSKPQPYKSFLDTSSDDDYSCDEGEEYCGYRSDYYVDDYYYSDPDNYDYCMDCGCVHDENEFRSELDRFYGGCHFDEDDDEEEDDDYDSELDSDLEEFSDRIAEGGSAFIYALGVGAYLRNIFNDSNPIVRARITDFIRYSSTIDYSNITQSFENFRNELSELSGNPLTNFPVFNPIGQSAPSGMNASDISRLPRHSYLGQTQREKRTNEPAHKCCICMAELEVGEELILLDKCSHRFHSGCLESWLKRSNQCPICRSVVNPPPILIN